MGEGRHRQQQGHHIDRQQKRVQDPGDAGGDFFIVHFQFFNARRSDGRRCEEDFQSDAAICGSCRNLPAIHRIATRIAFARNDPSA